MVFIQHGDYAEAVRDFAEGGEETYIAMRHNMEYVASLADRGNDVTEVCLSKDYPAEMLPNGVRAVGHKLFGGFRPRYRGLNRIVGGLRPTHVVSGSPVVPLLRWCVRTGVRVLPLLADSFRDPRLRRRFGHWKLSRVLRRPEIRWVSNHNLMASREVVRIGVSPEKVVPWDLPYPYDPDDHSPKSGPEAPSHPRFLYVGALTETKGIGDSIDAVAIARKRGWQVTLNVLGAGQLEHYRAKAESLGVADSVQFLGTMPLRKLVDFMREHDAVLVPSQRVAPDGLPTTIYLAYCSRTPLVVSDHPMYEGKIHDGVDCVVFPGGSAEGMADRLHELLHDPALYARVSEGSAQGARDFATGAHWDELIEHWLGDSDEDRAWLAARTLAAMDGGEA
ncbi:MAG: glycosyltransferase family 4 protein [Planctomycetota bacterium]